MTLKYSGRWSSVCQRSRARLIAATSWGGRGGQGVLAEDDSGRRGGGVDQATRKGGGGQWSSSGVGFGGEGGRSLAMMLDLVEKRGGSRCLL
jgi:hypothetical protein